MAIDTPQPFTDHLDEIRRRLIIVLIWFVLFSALCLRFVDPILDWLAKPVGHFIFFSPTEALFVRFKIGFGLGAVAAFPIFLYQSYRFVAVALKDREKTIAFMIVPFALFLFLIGTALALFAVAPLAVKFLMGFGNGTLIPMISVEAYLSFLFWMVMGFGILFQLPLVVVILCRAGIVEPATLAGYRRHVLIGLLIIAAILTPGPDIISQIVLTLPSYILFEISLLLVRIWK